MKKWLKSVVSLALASVSVVGAAACGKSEKTVEYSFDDYYAGIDHDKRLANLVKDGNTKYKIVIPAEASATEKQAANELQYYIASANSAYFSIGETKQRDEAKLNTKDLDLNGDGFVVKTVGENIIVDAQTDRGFLYGTYEMIEKMLGVRWFAADETYIPQVDEVPVYEMNVVSVPAFEYRTYYSWPEAGQGFDALYSAHSRVVSNWAQPLEQYGGKHNMYYRGTATHNSRFFVPASKYGTHEINGDDVVFEEGHEPHPEFYVYSTPPSSWNGDGKRMWKRGGYQMINYANGITEDGKLDETMELSVAKIVIEEMKKDILANPDAKYFELDQEDNINPVVTDDPVGYPDHYALTQKYGTAVGAAVMIRFMNVVASELQKWADEELNGREINIVTIAYNQTQYAPTKWDEKKNKYVPLDETVVPVDNLYIRLAYSAFLYLPLNDQRQSATVREMGASWSSICKNFWFWGYDLIAEDYMVYNPTWGAAYETVQFLRDIGVQYVMEQGTYNAPNEWQGGIKHYIWTKLLWNPDQDATALMNEYLAGFYGMAAPYVKRMIELLDAHYGAYVHNLPDPGKIHRNYWTSEIGTAEVLTVRLVDDAIAIIEEGEAAVNADPTLNRETQMKLLRRLAAVKVTPMWMKLKYWSALCPLDDAGKKAFAIELNETATFGGVTRLSEHDNLIGKLAMGYGI